MKRTVCLVIFYYAWCYWNVSQYFFFLQRYSSDRSLLGFLIKKKVGKVGKKNQFWKSWKKSILKKLEKINFEKVGKKSWKSSKAFLHCSPQEAPSGTPGRSPQKTIAPQPVCIIELPGQLQYNKPIKKNCYHICSMYAQWYFCLSKDNKNSYANNQATEIGKKKNRKLQKSCGFPNFSFSTKTHFFANY